MHTEALLERWPFSVGYHHAASKLRLMFSSEACLSLVATPAAFRSLGDARCFLNALAAPASVAASQDAGPVQDTGPAKRSKPASLCYNYRCAGCNWLGPIGSVHNTVH